MFTSKRLFKSIGTFQRLDVLGTNLYENVAGLVRLPCRYTPVSAIPPGQFQSESPGLDKVLVFGYYPAIEVDMRLLLTTEGHEKRFLVKSAKPVDGAPRTLLSVDLDPQQATS